LGRIIFHDSFQMWPGAKAFQPQPKRKRAARPTRRADRRSEGRAADEAAAMRKLQACPLADAKAARLREAPKRFPAPSGDRSRQTGRAPARPVRRKRDLRIGAPPTGGTQPRLGTGGQGRASARNCERQPQGFGSWTVRQQPRRQPRCRPIANPGVSAKGRRDGQEDGKPRFSGSAERRTARASALTGSPRGKPERSASFAKDPGETARAPARDLSRNLPARTASPPRLGVHPRRDSGGWR
jgi:hypothetical protein